MRHRRRPGWLAPSTSASPHLSGMTVATRRRWGRRRCRSSRSRSTRHCPRRGSGPSRRRTARSAKPPATRRARRCRPRTPRTPRRHGQNTAVVRRLARELAAAPAHRHDIRMGRRVVDGGEQVAITGGAGLDQHDARPGRHGVRPLHVERLLELPTARRIAGRITRPAGLVDPRDRRGGQPELGVECVQIGLDVRVVVGIDDGDRLAVAVPATPLKVMLLNPYACWICAGVYAPEGGPPPAKGRISNVGWATSIGARAEQRARFEIIDPRPQATQCRGAATARSACCSRAHRRIPWMVQRWCGFKTAYST